MKLSTCTLLASMLPISTLAGSASEAWTADYREKDPKYVHASRSSVAVFYDNGALNATVDYLRPSTGEMLSSFEFPERTNILSVADYTDVNGEVRYFFITGFQYFHLYDPALEEIKWSFELPDYVVGIFGTPTFSDDGSQVFVNTEGFIWSFETASGAVKSVNIEYTRSNDQESWGPYNASVSSILYHDGSLYTALAESQKTSYCSRPTFYRYIASSLTLEEKWELPDSDCGSDSVLSCCGWAEYEAAPVLIEHEENQYTIVVGFQNYLGTVGFNPINSDNGPRVAISDQAQYSHAPAANANMLYMHLSGEQTAFQLDTAFLASQKWQQDNDNGGTFYGASHADVDGTDFAFYCYGEAILGYQADNGFLSTEASVSWGSQGQCSISPENKLMVYMSKSDERIQAFNMNLEVKPPTSPPTSTPTVLEPGATLSPTTNPTDSSASAVLFKAPSLLLVAILSAFFV